MQLEVEWLFWGKNARTHIASRKINIPEERPTDNRSKNAHAVFYWLFSCIIFASERKNKILVDSFVIFVSYMLKHSDTNKTKSDSNVNRFFISHCSRYLLVFVYFPVLFAFNKF